LDSPQSLDEYHAREFLGSSAQLHRHPVGVPYVVKKGDTLWGIAAAELGSPWEWPRLYAFNTREAVVRSGVRRITDPDLIFAGETI